MTEFLINAGVNLFIVFGILLILAFIAGILKILSEIFKDWAEECEVDKKIPIKWIETYIYSFHNYKFQEEREILIKMLDDWRKENEKT